MLGVLAWAKSRERRAHTQQFSRRFCPPYITSSHSEQLAVARLDLLAHLFHRRRIVLHLLDLAERLAPGLLLDPGMQRTQAADIDRQLLRLGREAEALEQPRGVRIGGVLEQRVGADDEGRALGRVDDLDRAALLLLDEHVV